MEVLGDRHRRGVRKAAAPVDIPTRCSGCDDVLLTATGAADVCLLVRRGIADAPAVAGHHAEKIHVGESSTITFPHNARRICPFRVYVATSQTMKATPISSTSAACPPETVAYRRAATHRVRGLARAREWSEAPVFPPRA